MKSTTMSAPRKLVRFQTLFFFFMAVCPLFSSRSQGVDIRGVVSDSTTREPIPYANIQIIGTSRGAAANIRGFYFIPNLPPGPYRIVATAVGYGRREIPVTLEEGSRPVVDFSLASTTVELSEVVISAQGISPIFAPGSSLRRLDQRELKAVPVPVQADVIRSLLILPGIVSTSDVNSRFYVRGGAGDQNLILLDGMRLYSPFHALGVYSVLDPEVIRSTEVHTGAFPAGFGGRLSSVVSLTTKDPRADRHTVRSGLNILSSNLELQGPLSSGTQLLASGRLSLFPRTFRRLSKIDRDFSFYDLLIKGVAEIPGLNKLGMLVFLTGDDLRSRASDEANYQWRNQLIGVTSSGLVANRMYLAASAYVSRYWAARTPDQRSSIPPTSTEIQQPGLRIDATVYTSRPSDLYNFGFEFAIPQVSYNLVNTVGTRRPYRSTPSEVATWVRYQTALGDLRLDGGIHVNLADLKDAGWRGFEPRGNASYHLGGNWNLRLAFARISQSIVTANNEDDLIPIFDAWIGIPKGLKPETADHYVTGIDGPLMPTLSLSLQAYRKQYFDLLLYNRNKITERDPDFIGGTGRSWGVESLLRFSDSPIDLYLAYTFSRTTVTSLGFTYAPRFDVRHNLNVLATVRLMESLNLSVRWDFKTGYPFTQIVGFYGRLPLANPIFDPFEIQTGAPFAILGAKNAARLTPYHRLDLSLSYRFEFLGARGGLDVSLINIYDRKNIFYFERETGRRVNMLPFFPSVTLTLSL